MSRTILLAVAVLLVAPRLARGEMFKIQVKSVTIQDVGDDDQPKGKVRPVAKRASGALFCRLEEDPKRKTFTAWIQTSVDDSGKTLRTHSKGGAPDEVISCASQYIVNLKLPAKEGEYRVTANVTFTVAKCDARGICR